MDMRHRERRLGWKRFAYTSIVTPFKPVYRKVQLSYEFSLVDRHAGRRYGHKVSRKAN